jgi:hypothetical protein
METFSVLTRSKTPEMKGTCTSTGNTERGSGHKNTAAWGTWWENPRNHSARESSRLSREVAESVVLGIEQASVVGMEQTSVVRMEQASVVGMEQAGGGGREASRKESRTQQESTTKCCKQRSRYLVCVSHVTYILKCTHQCKVQVDIKHILLGIS